MSFDKQHVMGAAAEASEPALVNQAPAGLAPTGFDQAHKMFLNRKEVAGTLAMWAVRQCPYTVPDKLAEAVTAAHDALPEELEGWFWATENELREIVETICLNDPLIVAWNTPKSGHNANFVFSSRYDGPAPEDDFIDLHALANNVCRTLIADQAEYMEEATNG